MVARRSGNQIKTDRRDAISLVRLFRAGELASIYVPKVKDEAIGIWSAAGMISSNLNETPANDF